MMSKNDVKKGQQSLLDFLKENTSLALSGIGVKQKFLWSSNILWKLHVREKSSSHVMSKLALGEWDFSIL